LRQTANPKIFRKIKDDDPEVKIHASQTMVFPKYQYNADPEVKIHASQTMVIPKYQNNAKSGGLGDSPGRKARPSNLLKVYFPSLQDQTGHKCKEFSQ
jgi:hypothetical protein